MPNAASSIDAMPSRSATWSSESSRSISAASLGRPSTRSPMMLRWICDAPAAIVSASVRSRSSTSSLSSTCSASRSSTRRHSSPNRWRASEYASFITIAPGPTVPRAACETLRFVSAHSASNSAAHRPSSRRCAGSCDERREVLAQPQRVDELAHERGAALVLQRDVRDAPAVVLGADAVRDRHAHVGEEHLGELRAAEHGLERAHLDAGQVHRQDQPRDAAVLRRVGIGAHEELADVGDLAERAPDLLAVEHVVVAVAHRRACAATRGRSPRPARRSPGTTPRRRAGSSGGARPSARRCPLRSASGPRAACRRSSRRRTARARGPSLRRRSAARSATRRGRRTPSASAGPRSRRRTGGAASRCPTCGARPTRRAAGCGASAGSSTSSHARNVARNDSSASE